MSIWYKRRIAAKLPNAANLFRLGLRKYPEEAALALIFFGAGPISLDPVLRGGGSLASDRTQPMSLRLRNFCAATGFWSGRVSLLEFCGPI